MMKFRENEDAVSPVIGVILMVAITVILAAVIAAFVFGMTDSMPDTTKNVAISVKAATGSNIMITIQGGTDLPRLDYLAITIDEDSTERYYTDPTDNKIIKGTATSVPASHAGSFTVGSVWKSALSGTDVPLESGASKHVVVVGVFNDGSEQILSDTYL